MSRQAVPRFLLGHNALIGVNHKDRALADVKTALGEDDRRFLRAAAEEGLAGIVLDNHPVAVEAARFLHEAHPSVRVFPMVPYAQEVVDSASKSGLGGIVKDMAATSVSLGPGPLLGAAGRGLLGDLTGAGARVAMGHYLRGFPKGRHPVVFLHNAVTDLLLAWNATHALKSFADAARARGSAPGFVTLNPGRLPDLVEATGEDAWFMCAVNSRGIQMSPGQAEAERALDDPRLNVVAMSVLGGGLLDPKVEIPRAFKFPAVKSVVVGTTKVDNLRAVRRLAEGGA